MIVRERFVLTVSVALLTTIGAVASGETTYQTFEYTDAEKKQFLQTATIVRRKALSIGVTGSERATLTDGKLTHDAHIQDVDIRKVEYTTIRGTELNFRDSYKYNIAAYHLDRLLNLNMVPVSVERKISGSTAAVTWWVDSKMMEKERYEKKIQPPDQARWNDQIYQARIFNELVYNTDANLGNFLITEDWDLWMVDFTRAFRLHQKLRNRKNLVRIDRRVYEGLKALHRDLLVRELSFYLTEPEIKALLARRDWILKCFDDKIARLGEAAVICDLPGH